MIGFPFAVEVAACVVVETEFLLFQQQAIHLFLTGVFAHEFQQDRAIAVEDVVCFSYHFCRGLAEF